MELDMCYSKTKIYINNLKPRLRVVITPQERRSNIRVDDDIIFHLCTFSTSAYKVINYLDVPS